MQSILKSRLRGSPHIHSFIWTLNATKLSKLIKEGYAKWVNNVIRVDLSDPDEELELWELVRTYQNHRHCKIF